LRFPVGFLFFRRAVLLAGDLGIGLGCSLAEDLFSNFVDFGISRSPAGVAFGFTPLFSFEERSPIQPFNT
jgi:hypothetical protein